MTPHSDWGWVQGHLAGRLVDRQGQLELKILEDSGISFKSWALFSREVRSRCRRVKSKFLDKILSSSGNLLFIFFENAGNLKVFSTWSCP